MKLLNAIQKQMLKHLKVSMNEDCTTIISQHVIDKLQQLIHLSCLNQTSIVSSHFFIQLTDNEQIILLNLLNK